MKYLNRAYICMVVGENQFSFGTWCISTMKNKRIVIYLIFWLFQIHRIYTFEDDEYYCQGVYDSYAYCRRCPNANGYCEAPRSCQCENIELYNNNRK